ncbi:alpha/beta hydrolase fold domain-containing protein [Nocardioides sp.]|uniref:alpha/beta hydrolase fold domain-containing protein n=1 Tax=Nocardioides sp. TaxID=35761 RepID=UPI002732BB07|nr:alpha/beta hydrolase [Nocardioides sp.]MDP3892308.1 alpha/beta hydrolase [Nocardioides sp.]
MRLRRDKQAFEGVEHTLSNARDLQDKGDRPPTRITRLLFQVRRTAFEDLTTWRVRPRRRPPTVRVLYLHGGGYIHPLTADYWRLARALARAPAEVVVPAYPLAPDATVEDVLPQLLRYAGAVTADSDLPLVLMGDSAGGALVLAMARELRDLGAQLPSMVVALSPWLDASLAAPEVEDLEPTDPMLAESGLRAAGRWWSGDRKVEDPVVSPVHDDLKGLPPTMVYIGDRDILRPAVDSLAKAAAAAHADLHVREVSSMFHVWMTRAIPEARRTRRQLREVIRRQPPERNTCPRVGKAPAN